MKGFTSVSAQTRAIAEGILNRDLFVRAYAFSSRWLAGLDALDEDERKATNAIMGSKIFDIAADDGLRHTLEEKIATRAGAIGSKLGGNYSSSASIATENVELDLPPPDR